MAIVDEAKAPSPVRKLYDWSLKDDTYRFSKYGMALISRTETGTTNSTFFFFFVSFHSSYPSRFRALVRDEFFARRNLVAGLVTRTRQSLLAPIVKRAWAEKSFSTMLSDPCQAFAPVRNSETMLRKTRSFNVAVRASMVRTHARGAGSRVTPRRTRGREEKWRVFATSRREKRGRAFLRKVGREGIRLYTYERAEASPAGHPPRRPCLKRACG